MSKRYGCGTCPHDPIDHENHVGNCQVAKCECEGGSIHNPELRLSGRTYRTSHFVELVVRLTRKHEARPPLLDFVKAGIIEAVRRNQEWNGDSLRSAGGSEGHGKGDHADPTASTAAQTLPWDEVDALTQAMAEHIVEGHKHFAAAASRYNRILSLSNEGRRNSLIECANKHCETVMTGIGEDRPRAGRCEPCYRHLRKYDRDRTPRAKDEDAA